MKKLVLNVESLRVESFAPAPEEPRAAGTVHARESINPSLDGDTCPNHTCAPPPTFDSTPACCV